MKTKYIKSFNLKDLKLLFGLSRTGVFSYENIKSLDVSDRRIENMIRDNLIEKREHIENRNNYYIYKLTDQGYNFLKNNIRGELRDVLEDNLKERYGSRSVKHDLALTDKYLKLSFEEQLTWKTETQLRNQLNEHMERLREEGNFNLYNSIYEKIENRDISPVDGSYTSSTGQVIAVEVITKSYGEKEINAKCEFAQALNMEIEGYSIK